MQNLEEIIYYTKKLSVLYVEDNKEARENTLFIFEEFFDNLLVAVDGLDGLEKFQEAEHIDLIITDINMPNCNGLDMLTKIRALDTNVQTLILSAYNESNFFIDSIKLDVAGYLLKPIDMEQFLNTLYKIIQQLQSKEKTNKTLHLLKQYQEITDASNIISKTTPEGLITYVNDEFCKISGFSKEELVGNTHAIVKSGDKDENFYKHLHNTIQIEKKIWQGIFKNKRKNGTFYYIKATIKPILDINNNIIEFLSLMDDITDVMNPKKQFYDLVSSYEESIVLLIQMNDIEDLIQYYGYSTINDIEEELLRLFYKNLPQEFQEETIYTLEYGEYGLVRDKKTFQGHTRKFVHHLKAFQNIIDNAMIAINGVMYDVSISISVAFGTDALTNAQYGLQKIKNHHSNFIVATNLTKKIQYQAEKNIRILKMVKNALQTNQIVSYLQPIIDNKTKKVVKYESLVRLIDIAQKVHTPFTFLEIAKKGKYYQQITQRVLENSFKIVEEFNIHISINLSASDFHKESIRLQITDFCKKNPQLAKKITIELLEDEEIKGYQYFLSTLKELGLQIAIDDFGTGYSNFEKLLSYKPDILKIDGSLIKNIVHDKFSHNLVETMVGFAKKQNLLTIAEYVENEEIYNIVCNLGIDFSQGYYFSKPLPTDEIF